MLSMTLGQFAVGPKKKEKIMLKKIVKKTTMGWMLATY